MWRIRYTLRGRPTIAITHATGHALIVRRLERASRTVVPVDPIRFAVSRGHRRRVAQLGANAKYGKEESSLVALRDRIAMWVTSHECVEQAPHEVCSRGPLTSTGRVRAFNALKRPSGSGRRWHIDCPPSRPQPPSLERDVVRT